MPRNKKTGSRLGHFGLVKKPPLVKKQEITRDEIKAVLGGAKFTLKEVKASDWSAYRIAVEGLPEGIVTVNLNEATRGLYDRVIRICRENTFKDFPIIRGDI